MCYCVCEWVCVEGTLLFDTHSLLDLATLMSNAINIDNLDKYI